MYYTRRELSCIYIFVALDILTIKKMQVHGFTDEGCSSRAISRKIPKSEYDHYNFLNIQKNYTTRKGSLQLRHKQNARDYFLKSALFSRIN